ncbi:MAG: DUF6175 family protein [Cytophagales bacterium]
MKKIFVIASLVMASLLSFAQAKKPTIMVVPSDAWCNINNCMTEFNNQGTIVKVPNYKAALLNTDMLLVISKINTLMSDRGFPLKDLGASMKSLESDAAETAMTTSKSGAGVSESPIDKLKKTAKADIIIQLTYTINVTGPKKSITYNMQGLDAYTDKQIAGAQGTGAPSFSAELPLLLEEAVLANLDNYNAQLQKHFDDMFANGREITMKTRKFDSWAIDLEEEIGGNTVGEIIEAWFAKNAVKGRFSTQNASENSMDFEQIRMPIYDENGKALDARAWIRQLQKYLKTVDPRLDSKLTMKGLGQATLTMGEK